MAGTRRAGRMLGNLQISRALELTMSFDPQMFFPHISKDEWLPYREWLVPRAMDPQTGDLLLPCQSYIVRTSLHTILIDSCVGNDKERTNRPAWHQKSDSTYLDALAANGLAPEDIDYVMCTHLHGDHVGWNTRLVNGEWVPTFPNAKYIFSEKEFDQWKNVGHEKFTDHPLVDSVLPIVAAGRAQLVSSDFALDDEVWLEPSPGHTPDHFSVRLKSQGANAVMTGDMMHSPIQCVHPEWIPWPDWDPEQAIATRRSCLETWADTDMLVCTAHFPLPSAGRIGSDAGAWRFEYDEHDW